MKLTIEVEIRDNLEPLNEACKTVVFSDNWAKLTPSQAHYFVGLVKADLDFAGGIFNEVANE